jgi:hypothetical protein
MKEFIRKRLLEAIKSNHWIDDSYPTRIIDSTFKDLGDEAKVVVDRNIKVLESLEFGNDGDKIGVWLYKAPIDIKHPPFKERDKGSLLLAIVNNNNMTTLYWKHKKEGEYDKSITLDKLIEFSKSEFYDPIDKPITIKRLLTWEKSLEEPKVKREAFKKINLSNNSKVKYYEDSNKFETIESQPINIKNVFPYLPNDEMMMSVFSKSTDDEKLELIDLIPSHLSDDAEKLLEGIRNKRG